MKKTSLFMFIFMLLFATGFIFNSNLNAKIITIDENFAVTVNPNDKIIYQKELETDVNKLYSMADTNSVSTLSTTPVSTQTNATISYTNGTDSENKELESNSCLQHYLTIERESGDIEKYYCMDSFTDIPISTLKDTTTGEFEIVTPGEGTYDSTYSARAWAKIHYIQGTRNTSTEYFEYVKALWFRGTVQQLDSSVTVSNRRIWIRNYGFDLNTRAFQNLTKGPYYAASGSNTVTRNAPSSFYTLLNSSSYPHEIVCTCQADISRSGNTWYLQTTIRECSDGISR